MYNCIIFVIQHVHTRVFLVNLPNSPMTTKTIKIIIMYYISVTIRWPYLFLTASSPCRSLCHTPQPTHRGPVCSRCYITRIACLLPVFDQPVVLAGLCAISHSQHAVVKSGLAAEEAMVDTGPVELEAGVAGVDGDTDGSHGGHCRLQGVLVLALDVHEPCVGGANIGCVELAFLVLFWEKMKKCLIV